MGDRTLKQILLVTLASLVPSTVSADAHSMQKQRAEHIYKLSTEVTPVKDGKRKVMIFPVQGYFSNPVRISGCLVTMETWVGGYNGKESQLGGETKFNLRNVDLPNPNTKRFQNDIFAHKKWGGAVNVTAHEGHYIKHISLLTKPQKIYTITRWTLITRSFAAETNRFLDFLKTLWAYQLDYCSKP